MKKIYHIDILWIAIQLWVKEGSIKLQYTLDIINNSNLMTKLLGFILLQRYTNKLIGYIMNEGIENIRILLIGKDDKLVQKIVHNVYS